jgi:hypothetical protein
LIIPSSAYIENPVFTRIESHGVANPALPLKKTVFNPARVRGDIVTFNPKQFQAASFHSTITDIPNPATNPPSVDRRVEVVRNIDQIMADVEVSLREMEKRPNIIEEERNDDCKQSGNRHEDIPFVWPTQTRPPKEAQNANTQEC